MVLYFSATGNTEYIANQLASRLQDECVNILDRVKTNNTEPLTSDKPYVICAPVYVCEMPRFMAKHLKKTTFNGNREVYFVFTSGGYAGISGQLAESLIKKKDLIYKGHAEVTMPRNYVANDHYPMLEKEAVEERITNAYGQLDDIAGVIKSNGRLEARHVQLWETIVTVPFNPVWCKLVLKDKDFHVNDKCMGCGKCEKLCPLNNIKMVDEKPTWNKNCTHCMACIGNCPVEAIGYGKMTDVKTPYNIGQYQYLTDQLEQSDEGMN